MEERETQNLRLKRQSKLEKLSPVYLPFFDLNFLLGVFYINYDLFTLLKNSPDQEVLKHAGCK